MVGIAKLIKPKTPEEKRKDAIIDGFKGVLRYRYEDGVVYEWNETIVHTEIRGFKKVKIQATPSQIMRRLFDGIDKQISADPITDPTTFRQQVFDKFHDRRFWMIMFNSRGEAHTFYGWLEWKA